MDTRLKKYAELLIACGVNIRKGQTLVISAPIENAPFAHLCAAAAYDHGCREVVMSWSDEWMTREKYLRASDEVFDRVAPWWASFNNDYAIEGAARLAIDGSNPEALKGVDPGRVRRASAAAGKAMEPYRSRQMANKFQWCVAAAPTAAWAGKVFPELPEDKAVAALWDAILATVRVDAANDPVEALAAHNRKLAGRRDRMTKYAFRELHYQNALGTDLTVGLPEHHVWAGGSETDGNGNAFNANLPSEELFGAPHREKVNGTVFASKPLILSGNIVEDFGFELKGGKIVRVIGGKGAQYLENAISVDEGASYLGEVALVPYDSPISNSGILYYNTLFDENASCHFAFGDAYPCVEGGADMSPDEQRAAGLNQSVTHVDFMVGTKDLTITGITADGKEIPVFTDGNFAF